MERVLKNCWEIKRCGREKGGSNVADLGECVASAENLGHSCWIIAGTLCDGKVQSTGAEKIKSCTSCEVYDLYNSLTGSEQNRVFAGLIDEVRNYNNVLYARLTKARHRATIDRKTNPESIG